jgi:hypothetical protein
MNKTGAWVSVSSHFTYQIYFPLIPGRDSRRNILPVIDRYLDTMEEISGFLIRHFEFFGLFSRKLINISSEAFLYRIECRIIPPVQLPLDSGITTGSLEKWLFKIINRILEEPDTRSIDRFIQESADEYQITGSFHYAPIPENALTDKILILRELNGHLGSLPHMKIVTDHSA